MELHVGDVVRVKGSDRRGSIVAYRPYREYKYDVDFGDGSYPLAYTECELEFQFDNLTEHERLVLSAKLREMRSQT